LLPQGREYAAPYCIDAQEEGKGKKENEFLTGLSKQVLHPSIISKKKKDLRGIAEEFPSPTLAYGREGRRLPYV